MSPEDTEAVKKIAEYASSTEEEALKVIIEAGIRAVTLNAYNNQNLIAHKKRKAENPKRAKFMMFFISNSIGKNEPLPSEPAWRSALGLETNSHSQKTDVTRLENVMSGWVLTSNLS